MPFLAISVLASGLLLINVATCYFKVRDNGMLVGCLKVMKGYVKATNVHTKNEYENEVVI